MTFDNNPDPNFDMEETLSRGPSNRPFFIVAGILAGFTLIALLGIAAYAFYYVPLMQARQQEQVNQVNAQNTEIAAAITQTSVVAAFTSTPTPTELVTPTPAPTLTPLIVISAATTAPTVDPRTATVAALLTQVAVVQQTSYPGTPYATATALPVTGFADEVGVPGMIGLAVLLIAVIVLTRRLRTAT